ncbi:MAG: hypothetical protein E6R04_08155 [Spirochaetes bacterium]|nr:MAG: hypothetical protein E6R04_08155 [Spirochaetota bacterium]
MTEDFKLRIQKSVLKHATRELAQNQPKRKNGKPERKLQAQMMSWLSSQGFFVFPLESKSVYSSVAGRYLDSQTRVGASDILGVTPQGYFLAVEVKARGRRSTLRDAQRIFLESVLSKGGFAVCSDSIEHLDKIYHSWLNTHPNSRARLLQIDLPPAKASASNETILFGVNE